MTKTNAILLLLGVTLVNAFLMHDALTKTERLHQKSLALVESSLNNSLRRAEGNSALSGVDVAQLEQVKTLMATMPIGHVKP